MVEILVAIVIGMLVVIIIMQVLTQSEAGRRTTSNVAGAQTGGQLATFLIQRDLIQAGQGLVIDNFVFGYTPSNTPSLLNCRVASNLPFNGLPVVPVAIIPAGIAPGSPDNLWNIPQGDADSDMIAVAFGMATTMVEGVNVDPNPPAAVPPVFPLASAPYGINAAPGERDYMIVSENGLDCTLGKAVAVDVAARTVTLDQAPVAGYSTRAALYNLGPSNLADRWPRFAVYAVRNGMLTVCNFFPTGASPNGNDCTAPGSVNNPNVWTPVADNVVALRAQYGWETSVPPVGVVDSYCRTRLGAGGVCPGADSGSPAPSTIGTAAQKTCDWTRIGSVRFAVVVRSGQYEKTTVSPATLKLWPDSAVAPLTTGPVYTVPDQHYRYRVFESAVALRSTVGLGGGRNSATTSQCYN
jgi:type IV pilus assembly protein PilW